MIVKGSIWLKAGSGERFGVVRGYDQKGRPFVKVGVPRGMTAQDENAAAIAENGAPITREQLREVLEFAEGPNETKAG